MEHGKGSPGDDRSHAQRHAWRLACREVSARSVDARRRVARTLADCGPTALVPLCGALFDPALKVRRAAARSLGILGDARAIPALRLALRATMLGGGASAHRMAGWAALVSVGVAELAFLLEAFLQQHHRTLAVGALCLYAVLMLGVHLAYSWADNRADLRLALVTALAKIAACDGSPQARASLPELDALSRTPVGRNRQLRQTLERALEVIRSLPEPMPLPIPAAREDAGASDLPIVPESFSSAGPARLLPIPDDPR